MKQTLPPAAACTDAPRASPRATLVLCLVGSLVSGCGNPTDAIAQRAAVAEDKAEVLERNSAADGSKTAPPAADIITKPEAQAVDPAGEQALDEVIVCLSRTVYWEAKGEGPAGMEAIANVVMNRLGHEGFPDTICEVVRQGHERGACQFSWWCDGRPDDAEEEENYKVAKEVARKALNRQLLDSTGGAMYFHHRGLHPDWAAQYLKTAEIGEHIFYKPRGGEAM